MILVNRLLYAAMVVVFIIGLIAKFIPDFSADNLTVEALKVKAFDVESVVDSESYQSRAKVNFFDLMGEHWWSAKSVTDVSTVGGSVLLGVVHIQGVEGVLTNNGLVLVGQLLNGGRLLRIEDGQAVIDISGREKRLGIDVLGDHYQQKFKSFGFPFFK